MKVASILPWNQFCHVLEYWPCVFGFCAPIGKRNIKKGGLFFPMFSAPIGTRSLKTKTKTPFLIFDF